MDVTIKEDFINRWKKYFKSAGLPLALFYSDNLKGNTPVKKPNEWRCVICDFRNAINGKDLYFGKDSLGCSGGMRYCGFADQIRPGIEYFLSYGIKGEMEGERYLKTPEIARKAIADFPSFKASGKYFVVKRWDNIEEDEDPLLVLFFASANVLSGLFTLANYDEAEADSVICPFGSGCSSIVQLPLKELQSKRQRAVLGMFDVSARPCVPEDELSFTVPFPKFKNMIENMDESFLITDSWKKVWRNL